MAAIQATRLKKGMLVKIEQDLFRVLELQHVTPGNLRGFVRVKFRNIRNGSLSDQKLRSEDTLDRATLEQRDMQYLYKDGVLTVRCPKLSAAPSRRIPITP